MFRFYFYFYSFLGAKHEEFFLLVLSMTQKGKDKKTMHKGLNSNLFLHHMVVYDWMIARFMNFMVWCGLVGNIALIMYLLKPSITKKINPI
jgi:hypothetical protein